MLKRKIIITSAISAIVIATSIAVYLAPPSPPLSAHDASVADCYWTMEELARVYGEPAPTWRQEVRVCGRVTP
jgi:hypothetical protein